MDNRDFVPGEAKQRFGDPHERPTGGSPPTRGTASTPTDHPSERSDPPSTAPQVGSDSKPPPVGHHSDRDPPIIVGRGLADLMEEGLLSFAEAAAILPRRRGRKAHISKLYRWATIGCRGVRLEYVQCGGTRCTSRAALARFFERLTTASGAPLVVNARTDDVRHGRYQAAERDLDRRNV